MTLNTDSDNSYKVTANVFSSDSQNYSGTVNETATLGPILYDCYEVVTSATNANLTNQVTFTKSDGQTTPNWMTFDTGTANVSISTPSEVSSDTYTISNSYASGVLVSSFTLDTNVNISITAQTNNTNDDDDYCLNASSKAVCGIFIALIVIGVFAPVIFILIVIYYKAKCKTSRQEDMSKIDQEQPEEDDQHPENDESAPLGHQNEMLKTETQGVNQNQEADDNQV